MTAAYTDDPTIAQEQHPEKRIAVAIKTSSIKKEQTAGEEHTEANSEEIMKLATGGQSKEEINADQDNCMSRISVKTSETNDDKDKEPLPYENNECLEESGKDEDSLINQSIDTLENKSEESLVDRDSGSATKSTTQDVIVTMKTDTVFHDEVSLTGSNTRGIDSSPKADRKCMDDGNDTPQIYLQDLQHSIEAIDIESKDLSNDLEACKDSSLEESITYQDFIEEVYDPESELNFHEAVRAGDAKCVAALLASGCAQNLDEPDWNVSGDPPLLVAATNHCLPVLSLLLANGCDPGVRSPRGETALHRVILNGGPGNVFKFVGELLKHGCPPGVKEAGGGLTALHVLTRQLAHAQGSKNLHHNFEAALKTLDLLARAGPVNAKDHQGRSALHILASSTIFDNNHRTEIESLIETLLAAGADPSLKNDRGETPLHECLECGALNTAFLLIPHTPTGIASRYGETPLHIASRKNYADMVAKLLEHGENPSIQDAGGNTPLHLASARGFHQTVSLLVTSPLAQLEKLNIEGLTALQVAAESGFVNAVRLLLKAGADPSQTVHYCTTTLHRHPDISILIDHELSRRRQLAA